MVGSREDILLLLKIIRSNRGWDESQAILLKCIECMWKLSGTGTFWIFALMSSTYLPTYPRNGYLHAI